MSGHRHRAPSAGAALVGQRVEACVLDPRSPAPWVDLARIHTRVGLLERTLANLKRAFAAGARDAAFLSASAYVFRVLGDNARSERYILRLLELPLPAAVRVGPLQDLATLRFLDGRTREGWALWHAAAEASQSARALGYAKDDDPASADARQDRPLLVTCGGDIATTIHHAAWFRRLAASHDVRFAIDPRLRGVMSRSFPDLAFVEADDPSRLRVDVNAVPFLAGADSPPQARLVSDPARTARWRRILTSGRPEQRLVGLCWRSSARNRHDFALQPSVCLPDLRRSLATSRNDPTHLWRKQVPLAGFRGLFEADDFQVVALQHGLIPEEAAYLRDDSELPIVVPDIDFFADLEEVVSLVDALDGIVSVPNTHAHIAAALGKPTVILSHERLIQFWPLTRHDPRYPRVEIVRKPVRRNRDGLYEFGQIGDWSVTGDEAHARLRRWLD